MLTMKSEVTTADIWPSVLRNTTENGPFNSRKGVAAPKKSTALLNIPRYVPVLNAIIVEILARNVRI